MAKVAYGLGGSPLYGAALGSRSGLGGRGGNSPLGGGLAEFGQDQERQAMGELGAAAEQETQRNVMNIRQGAENRAGAAKLGSTLGSIAGTSFGPTGSVVGGMLGGMAGSLF